VIGLYAIVHIPTNKAYVGSSLNIKRRIKEHKTQLKYNKHHCTYLQNAWNKYGETQFEFKIPTVVETIEEARELEQAFLECFFDKLFNINTSAVGAPCGEHHQAKRPDWHMKTVKDRLTEEERKEKYGKTKGTKRESKPYIEGAKKRLQNPMYLTRLSESCKGKRKTIECPHCNLKGGGGNMKRYHFDNCKTKNETK
jgi:group I intron endonuclease